MARKPANTWASTGTWGDDTPLAVPDLAIAAQLLSRPVGEVRRAARKVTPYPHADGTPYWSLRQLGLALGLVESRSALG
jgi:hypothetical protein